MNLIYSYWTEINTFSYYNNIIISFSECKATEGLCESCSVNGNCFLRLCTGKVGKIKCPSGSHLRIKEAWFGRTDPTVCSYVNVSDCYPQKELKDQQLAALMRICDNETECQLLASYSFQDSCYENVLGDPCPSKGKYLEVNFTCNAGGECFFVLLRKVSAIYIMLI